LSATTSRQKHRRVGDARRWLRCRRTCGWRELTR